MNTYVLMRHCINTWIDFRNELRNHFALSNVEKEARPRVCQLKQTGNIRDYIKDFTTLMLKIIDVFNKDSLFQFQDGLKDWVKVKLDRRGILDDAIAIAKSLVNYFAQPKGKRLNQSKGGRKVRKDKGRNRKDQGAEKASQWQELAKQIGWKERVVQPSQSILHMQWSTLDT